MQNLDNVYIWTMFFIGQERKRYEGGGGGGGGERQKFVFA